MTYGIPYAVRGWGDEIVTTVSLVVGDDPPTGYTAVVRGEGPVILIPTSALTPVDTTPPEPEPGAWLIGTAPCVRPKVAHVETRWLWLDDCVWYRWADLWAQVGGPGITPRRLVPEPAPVELPWTIPYWSVWERDDDEVTVTVPGPHHYGLKPDEAEAFGLALLSAARAAREATP